jgi:hypothetical protein
MMISLRLIMINRNPGTLIERWLVVLFVPDES